jgi:hypothetical protein
MDKLCRIVAKFGFGSAVVEEAQSEWHAAIARAAHRLAQNVARDLKRAHRSTTRTVEDSDKTTE